MNDDRLERLYDRAWAILGGRANGFGMPIMEALSRRGYPYARSALADLLSNSVSARERARGKALTLHSALRGDPNAARNLAIDYLNRGEMQIYRRWLAIAARTDEAARAELRAFRTRYPHAAMRRWHRMSPR